MMQPADRHTETPMQLFERHMPDRRHGACAWLGAFAVVLLQLQLATHLNLDHAANADFGDVCEVCLKLDASGKVPETGQPFVALPRAQSTPVTVSIPPRVERSALPHSARAPPRA
jgi:hypothetical protein